MAARPSLVEHAAANRLVQGTPCWMCSIPERVEVEAAVLAGKVTKAAAVRWLRTACGYTEASANRLDSHFAKHVDRPA